MELVSIPEGGGSLASEMLCFLNQNYTMKYKYVSVCIQYVELEHKFLSPVRKRQTELYGICLCGYWHEV
jgi:hypothetical protein